MRLVRPVRGLAAVMSDRGDRLQAAPPRHFHGQIEHLGSDRVLTKWVKSVSFSVDDASALLIFVFSQLLRLHHDDHAPVRSDTTLPACNEPRAQS